MRQGQPVMPVLTQLGDAAPGQRPLALQKQAPERDVTAYSTLKGAQIAQGTALWNLSLQLGGSLGIAFLNTYIVNMTQFHRAMLTSNFTARSLPFSERQAGLAQSLMAHGYAPEKAHTTAMSILDNLVQSQAATLAYNNAFVLIGVLFAFAFPIILILKRPAPRRNPAADALAVCV